MSLRKAQNQCAAGGGPCPRERISGVPRRYQKRQKTGSRRAGRVRGQRRNPCPFKPSGPIGGDSDVFYQATPISPYCALGTLKQIGGVMPPETDLDCRLLLQILDHGFGAGMDVKLLENIFHVALYGPNADVERVGDFFDEVASAQQRQDFMLARR